MAYTQEPTIVKGRDPEGTLRAAVVEELRSLLEQIKREGALVDYFILQDFGLDIAVVLKWSAGRCVVRFFELKAFVGSRACAVGFGNGQGKGPQVDLLLLDDSQLSLVNQCIRWILVDGTQPEGSPRFVMFDSIRAKNAAMGGVGRGKQNNLRVGDLLRSASDWTSLARELELFVTSENGPT